MNSENPSEWTYFTSADARQFLSEDALEAALIRQAIFGLGPHVLTDGFCFGPPVTDHVLEAGDEKSLFEQAMEDGMVVPITRAFDRRFISNAEHLIHEGIVPAKRADVARHVASRFQDLTRKRMRRMSWPNKKDLLVGGTLHDKLSVLRTEYLPEFTKEIFPEFEFCNLEEIWHGTRELREAFISQATDYSNPNSEPDFKRSRFFTLLEQHYGAQPGDALVDIQGFVQSVIERDATEGTALFALIQWVNFLYIENLASPFGVSVNSPTFSKYCLVAMDQPDLENLQSVESAEGQPELEWFTEVDLPVIEVLKGLPYSRLKEMGRAFRVEVEDAWSAADGPWNQLEDILAKHCERICIEANVASHDKLQWRWYVKPFSRIVKSLFEDPSGESALVPTQFAFRLAASDKNWMVLQEPAATPTLIKVTFPAGATCSALDISIPSRPFGGLG